MGEVYRLLVLADSALMSCDPLRLNLAVAVGVPGLEALDVEGYAALADSWAEDIRAELAQAEPAFHRSPGQWKGDIRFFRLGVLCWYVEERLGVRYNDGQRGAGPTLYTDPADLFLHGVMARRRGTCANMAALHVALGRRLGWPVSLACVGGHFICRFDDGAVTHNIEATQAGFGGFKSDPDDYLIRERGLPPEAVTSGSDLRALTPRELLGAFVGLRARLMKDTGRLEEAERDYLLARHLFPSGRSLYQAAVGLQVMRGRRLFAPHEDGSPAGLVRWLRDSGLDGWAGGPSAAGGWVAQGRVGFNAGDANLYRYVGNGPANAVDSTGLWTELGWTRYARGKYGETPAATIYTAHIKLAIETEPKGGKLAVRLMYQIYLPKGANGGQTALAVKYRLWDLNNSIKPEKDGVSDLIKYITVKLPDKGEDSTDLRDLRDPTKCWAATLELGSIDLTKNGKYQGIVGVGDQDRKIRSAETSAQIIRWELTVKDKKPDLKFLQLAETGIDRESQTGPGKITKEKMLRMMNASWGGGSAPAFPIRKEK